ncbi:hypothetical protein HK096_007225, partial [Nowakowskiella sp. JEL0078]
MDHGVAQDCSSGGTCSGNFPGLWEVPMYAVYDQNGVVQTVMDPLSTLLTTQSFDFHYNGNKAPYGLWLHSGWLSDAENRKALVNLLTYALSKPNVFVVTLTQLIQWMQNPVSASQLMNSGILPTTGNSCQTNPPRPSPCVSNKISCGSGGYYGSVCVCACPIQTPSVSQPVPLIPPCLPSSGNIISSKTSIATTKSTTTTTLTTNIISTTISTVKSATLTTTSTTFIVSTSTTSSCVTPANGCLYGTFNSGTCKCDCMGELLPGAGYCRDSLGRCTLIKPYNVDGTGFSSCTDLKQSRRRRAEDE